jgi:hypothetical protein
MAKPSHRAPRSALSGRGVVPDAHVAMPVSRVIRGRSQLDWPRCSHSWRSAWSGYHLRLLPVPPIPGRAYPADSECKQRGCTHKRADRRPQLPHADKDRDCRYGYPNPTARACLIDCWRDLRLPQPKPGPGEDLAKGNNPVDGTPDHEERADDQVKTQGLDSSVPESVHRSANGRGNSRSGAVYDDVKALAVLAHVGGAHHRALVLVTTRG